MGWAQADSHEEVDLGLGVWTDETEAYDGTWWDYPEGALTWVLGSNWSNYLILYWSTPVGSNKLKFKAGKGTDNMWIKIWIRKSGEDFEQVYYARITNNAEIEVEYSAGFIDAVRIQIENRYGSARYANLGELELWETTIYGDVTVKADGNNRFKYRKWNNTTLQWESEGYASENNAYMQYGEGGGNPWGESWSWDAVVDSNGNVYFVYLDVNLNVRFRIYNYSSGVWGTETTLFTANNDHVSPQLTICGTYKRIFLFWCGTPTEHHVYYKTYRYLDSIWESTVDWLDESSDELIWGEKAGSDAGSDGVILTFYNSLNKYIGLAVMTMTAKSTPYKIKFAWLRISDALPPLSISIEKVSD